MKGIPKNGDNGYQHRTWNYSRRPGTCTIEECYWDASGHLVSIDNPAFIKYIGRSNPYNRLVSICDTLNCTTIYQRYDNQKLLHQFQQRLTKDLQTRMGETSIDLMGQPARSHYANGLYYDSYTGNTIKGGWSTGYISVTNEYGEMGYRMDNDGNSPDVYAFEPWGQSGYLDEYGETIQDMSKFRTKLPRAFMIEVYDSTKAPRWDIRSGDVIMRYGDWHHPKLTTGKGYNLREATFIHDKDTKTMVVMRRNPQTNEAEAKEIVLGPGLPADFGFYFHDIFMTRKETDRYAATYKAYVKSLPEEATAPKAMEKKTKDTQDTLLFFRPYRSRGDIKNLYGNGVVDDAVILGVVTQDADGQCHQFRHHSGIETFDSCRFVKGRLIQKMWFTTDLRTVRSVELKKTNAYWDAEFWYNSTTDERICQPVKPLLKEANSQMDAYIQQLNKVYNDSLYNRYGDAAKAVKNDSVTVIFGRVDGDKGYMVEKGYSGMYIVLEWCGWKCTDGNDRFWEVFEQNRENNKQMLLMPVDSRDDVDFFGDILSITSDKPLLGLRISTVTISFDYFKKKILDKYQDYKK